MHRIYCQYTLKRAQFQGEFVNLQEIIALYTKNHLLLKQAAEIPAKANLRGQRRPMHKPTKQLP